jgi:hypothetical protein
MWPNGRTGRRRAASTCSGRLQQLGDALKVMAPDEDFAWVSRAGWRLHSCAKPSRALGLAAQAAAADFEGLSRYAHVFLIVEENKNYDQILDPKAARNTARPPTRCPASHWSCRMQGLSGTGVSARH